MTANTVCDVLSNVAKTPPDQDQQTDHHKNATQSPPPPTTRESNPVEDNTSISRSKDPKIQEITNKCSTVFEEQGKLNNKKIKLHIRDDVNLVMQPQRRIPQYPTT